jgi:dipeptidyl aminopeptidase/acylaminoacyl peptidase
MRMFLAGIALLWSSVAWAADPLILRPASMDGASVEIYVAMPEIKGKHPAILFVHGHQAANERNGGRVFMDGGRLEIMTKRGFVAAAVSQPGYGASDGPADYAGPQTQAAIREAIAHLRMIDAVDKSRIILYGFSRGAIAAALAASQEPDLKALILVSGTYDLGAAMPKTPAGLKEIIGQEIGTDFGPLSQRSVRAKAEGIRAKTLILHGRNDERAPLEQAEDLAKLLEKQSTPVVLKIIETGHVIPIADQWREINPFLAEVARRAQ